MVGTEEEMEAPPRNRVMNRREAAGPKALEGSRAVRKANGRAAGIINAKDSSRATVKLDKLEDR